MKKNVFLVVALLAFFTLGVCNAAAQQINSATDLKAYLDKQPANSPDKPIKVAMKVNDAMLKGIVEVIRNAGKYVSLDLSGSPLTKIPDYAFVVVETEEGCETLVGIIIPNGVTSIGDFAFAFCTNIKEITIPASVTSVGGAAFAMWTAAQTINIQGKANREATFSAGWVKSKRLWDNNFSWDAECAAKINYGK